MIRRGKDACQVTRLAVPAPNKMHASLSYFTLRTFQQGCGSLNGKPSIGSPLWPYAGRVHVQGTLDRSDSRLPGPFCSWCQNSDVTAEC